MLKKYLFGVIEIIESSSSPYAYKISIVFVNSSTLWDVLIEHIMCYITRSSKFGIWYWKPTALHFMELKGQNV
jgi:hypothetical protein